MNKRLLLLISIGLLAMSLVSLVMVTASAASVAKPASVGENNSRLIPAQSNPIDLSTARNSRSASLLVNNNRSPNPQNPAHRPNLPDFVRQQVMFDSQQEELHQQVVYPQGLDRVVKNVYRDYSSENSPEYLVNNGITMDLVRERVFGRLDPGDLITITRQGDGAYGSAQADGSGFFWTPLFSGDGSGVPVDIAGNEDFDIWVNGSLITVSLPLEAVGGVDVINDQVSGHLPGNSGNTQIWLKFGLWGSGPVSTWSAGTLTNPSGNFTIPLNFDAGAENFFAVEYPVATNVYLRTYFTPDPRVFLVEQNNLVAGYAPPNTAITATVYSAYPTSIRTTQQGNAPYPFGFFILDGMEIATGDVVAIEYEDGTVISTTNNILGQFSFDTDSDMVYGQAPPNALVRLNFWDWNYGYIETQVSAAPDGWFEAQFVGKDLRPSNGVDIMVADENGNQTHMVSGPPHLEVYLDPESEYDCVVGRVDAPGLPITLTVQTDHGTFTRENPIGPSDPGNLVGGYNMCYMVWGPGWGPIDFAPGDIVTLESPTWQGQVTVPDLTWEADTASEQISGSSPAGEVRVTLYQWNSDTYPAEGSAEARTVSNGNFAANFISYDVRDGNGPLEIRYYEPTTDFVTNLQAPMRFMQVELPAGVYGYTPIADEVMTVSLFDEANNLLASTSNDGDDNPFYFWYTEFEGNLILPGYKVEITGDSGWSASVIVPEITVEADVDSDLVYGEAPKGLLHINGGKEESGFDSFVPVDGYALSTAWQGHDLQLSDWIYVRYMALDGNRVMQSLHLCELCSVGFWLPPGSQSGIWGVAQPGATITITTPREQFNASNADPWGNWETPEPHDVFPGDEITVAASPGQFPVTFTIPDPLEAYADSSLGEVWGEIGGWDSRDVEVNAWWGVDPQVVQTDPGGTFTTTFAGMPGGARGHIRITDEIYPTEIFFLRPYYDLSPAIRVNYGHDWVESDYEPGFTVWITLTDSIGEVKATASGETGPIPWWDGGSGFATNYNVFWSSGNPPDIQPGDWVYVSIDNGHANQVRLGTIDGQMNVNTDVVSGTITVQGFTDPLYGNCAVWMPDGPWYEFEVDPNGGSFECNFFDLGWDLLPGHDVGVFYAEPDNDQVYNVFRAPAPHLWVNIWGEGDAAPGSNYILSLEYNNDGDALAQDVVITATLLEGMTYLGDTSGVSPSGTGQPGDPLVWLMGDLPVSRYSSVRFDIFVQVTAGQDEQIAAEATIETATVYEQGDPERKYSYWSGTVVENNTDLNIDKWTWTGDPLPDSDFVYVVHPCNQSNTASAQLILTDTLPLSTTLVTWWSENPGWEEMDRGDHLLVVSRPSLLGGRCSQVNIRVHLDAAAWQEMPLENNAEVFTSNDIDPFNNSTTMEHSVGGPHTNLSIWENWVSGNLVPGGQVNYEFRYQNTGNLPVSNVWVTNTLPANTTFLFAYTWGEWGWAIVTPTIVTPDYLVWDVGLLENGYGKDLGVVVQIDPQAEPGSILTHTAEISPQPQEDSYYDNAISWVEFVNEPGPNLRVDKHSNWRWNWEGTLEFELRILNMGSERLENVWITDTYPESTSFNDNWWQNHGPWITTTHDAENRTLTIWVESLNPGETASIGYQIDLNPEIIGEQGLSFTNLLEAPVAGDVFPEDNYDEVTAYTGPDVFIRKWLSGGILEPGEVVTFTVEFGNQNRWPWNGDPQVGSHITETLPQGMSFMTATAPWNPQDTWDPDYNDGTTVVWGWGPMWSENLWTFELSALISDTVQNGAVLTNTIEAYGDNPSEIEPNWDNNQDKFPFQLEFLKVFLPLVLK